MNVPKELKYTPDHEWIRVEGKTGFVGITDFAQGELGDVVFVDIASDLQEVTGGSTFGTIEAVKTVSDMLAPVSGKVIEVNPKLADEPQLINTDPYGEGWIIKIEIANPAELDSLMDAAAYEAQLGH